MSTDPKTAGPETSRRRGRRRQLLAPVGMWVPGEFLSALWGVNEPQYGLMRAGLAAVQVISGSPKGRRPPTYSIVHCGSGHRVCLIEADEAEAFHIADDLAALTDWNFDGLRGWQNTDPDLPTKIRSLCERHGARIRMQGGEGDEAAAISIAYARAV